MWIIINIRIHKESLGKTDYRNERIFKVKNLGETFKEICEFVKESIAEFSRGFMRQKYYEEEKKIDNSKEKE